VREERRDELRVLCEERCQVRGREDVGQRKVCARVSEARADERKDAWCRPGSTASAPVERAMLVMSSRMRASSAGDVPVLSARDCQLLDP
jgi:hypothetical protein